LRLFVAIDPPPAALEHLGAFVDDLGTVRAGVRVTARSLWHVTLAFLGEVPEDRLARAIAAVDRAVEGGPAAAGARLAGGGRFGRGRFTILWAGVDGDLDGLRRAATRALRSRRLAFDDQKFHPHLTLARPGDKVPREVVAADVAALAGYAGPQWTVDRLVLYRSHLGPRPWYEPLHVAQIPPAGPAEVRRAGSQVN
jgi:RNA 2',3'-cyclic 3'-phosphodiesterase